MLKELLDFILISYMKQVLFNTWMSISIILVTKFFRFYRLFFGEGWQQCFIRYFFFRPSAALFQLLLRGKPSSSSQYWEMFHFLFKNGNIPWILFQSLLDAYLLHFNSDQFRMVIVHQGIIVLDSNLFTFSHAQKFCHLCSFF